MALNFPDSPSVNDTYTSGGTTWQWDGTAWRGLGGTTSIQVQDDTSTTTLYPTMATATGTTTVTKVTTTKLTFNASTGQLNSTDFNTTSDAALKKDVRVVENAVSIVKRLEGVEFTWIEGDRPSAGVIAQQIEETLPHLIARGTHRSVNYNGLHAYLIEAIKEQQNMIERMEERIAQLEGK